MIRRLIFSAVFVFPALCPAASKEIMQLQRDVALLQDQLRSVQRTLDEKLVALTTLVQQSIDTANKSNTSISVFDNYMRERLQQQEKQMGGPMAVLSAKVDQMANEFQGLKETVNDLSARMGKIQQQLTDLGNAVKTMPAPPPTAGPAPTGNSSSRIPAEGLYENARRDMIGGKSDLALQEFTDYLRDYGNTEYAPNAQYFIGEIYYGRGDLDAALKAFDMVLEKFPENSKTADAMFMKGMTLIKMGQRTKGARELQEVVRRYRNKDVAARAQQQLRAMGLSVGAAASRKPH